MTEPSKINGESKKISSPKARRRGGAFFNVLLIIAIIALIALFAWAEQQRRSAREQLQETITELEQVRRSSERTGQEVADEVLNKLRGHMDIPTDPVPTVATIVDVESLRESSEFYQLAENGDHLIITERRAILYDPDRDIIIDVVPVNINPDDQAAGDEANPEGSPVASPGVGTQTTPAAESEATTSPTASPVTSPGA